MGVLVWSSEPVDENPKCDHSNENSWSVHSNMVVLVCNSEPVDENPKCGHSNENSWSVHSNGGISLKFWTSGRKSKVWPFKWKLLMSTF